MLGLPRNQNKSFIRIYLMRLTFFLSPRRDWSHFFNLIPRVTMYVQFLQQAVLSILKLVLS